jgi:hypothetical protein
MAGGRYICVDFLTNVPCLCFWSGGVIASMTCIAIGGRLFNELLFLDGWLLLAGPCQRLFQRLKSTCTTT